MQMCANSTRHCTQWAISVGGATLFSGLDGMEDRHWCASCILWPSSLVFWLMTPTCTPKHSPLAAYLVFDIQLLMGEGAVSISPDEYVFGALTLYLDVSVHASLMLQVHYAG
eukprot:scaffold243293_cov19-Tisochrysis_lutea.AAC.2